MADLDVLKALPILKFRGIELPLIGRTVNIQHDNVEHKFAFRDGVLYDGLGLKNWTFQYTIPFRQGIAKGPYSNLYNDTFPKFVEAFRDRTEGPLLDPVLGEFQVRPGSMSISTDINRRDGEDVSVDFVHSPALDTAAPKVKLNSLSGIASESQVLAGNQKLAELGFDLDSFLGDLSLLKAQASTFGSSALSDLNRITRTLKEFEDDITDPGQWPLQQAARQVRMGVEELKETAFIPGKEIIKLVLTGPKTIAAVASMTGMSTEDLLALNPLLPAFGPTVPGGTSVSYYKNS